MSATAVKDRWGQGPARNKLSCEEKLSGDEATSPDQDLPKVPSALAIDPFFSVSELWDR
jgi:hypothetical protein